MLALHWVFSTRSLASTNYAPPAPSLGHSPRQLASGPSTRVCTELLRPRCTDILGHVLASLAEELLCPFFRHLALVIFCSLFGLLLRPLKAHGTPLGGLVLLPTKGIPLGLFRPAAVWSVYQSAAAMQIAMPLRPRGRRTRPHIRCTAACRPVGGPQELERPVPTPCRAKGLPPPVPTTSEIFSAAAPSTEFTGAATAGSYTIQTLLEECVQSSARPYFLAATLLDTLLEHFGGAPDVTASVCYRQRPAIIQLAECLPAERAFDLTRVQLPVGCSIDDLVDL